MPSTRKIKPFIFGPKEDKPSDKTPTGHPTRVRHLVAYHNPDAMGYEFWQCRGYSVLTNRRYNDLCGDIVWVIGRPRGHSSYYLDCRFKVDRVEARHTGRFAYCVSGTNGFVFFPYSRLNTKPWFRRLLEINPHLAMGLQVVHDAVVLAGLDEEYTCAWAWQNGG